MGCERKQRFFLVSGLLSCLVNRLITKYLNINNANFFVSLHELRNSFVILGHGEFKTKQGKHNYRDTDRT